MPNFDGGHYFLTVLIPIRSNEFIDREGKKISPVHLLREEIAILPKARQSPVTEKNQLNSPFARNTRTHFARFVVIDDAIYNGRNPIDALKVAVGSGTSSDRAQKLNPTTPQSVDHLSCPYLLFVADFDAEDGGDEQLKAYLSELWETMGRELRSILTYCVGFDVDVKGDAKSFFAYIKRCQIETTMPFNDYDYRLDAPPAKVVSPTLLIVWAIVAVLATVIGILLAIITFIRAMPDLKTETIWWAALGVLGIAFTYALYRFTMKLGEKPFATAPDTTLPSVLKALYLQQQFTQFAIEAQGLDDQSLYAKFGGFLGEHKPMDLSAPTQAPGVIKS